MLASVNIHSDVAVYLQIENQVQFAIASNRLKPSDRLPAIKELSARLGVNPNTVQKAYRDLEVMGLIYTRKGMGTFVKNGVEKKCRVDCSTRVIRGLHEVVQEAKASGMSKKEVVAVVTKSIASGSDPYGEVPNSVMALANRK